jgi:hypothetical protein
MNKPVFGLACCAVTLTLQFTQDAFGAHDKVSLPGALPNADSVRQSIERFPRGVSLVVKASVGTG